MHPGAELDPGPGAREVPPGPDVGVLDGVAGQLLVTKDQARDRLHLGDRLADEQGKGILIAPPCSVDEFPLVHGHPRDAPMRAAFKGTGVGQP